jgi:endonuclease G
MNYKNILIPFLLALLLICESGCQQSQQTDFNTYGRKVQSDTLKNIETDRSEKDRSAIRPGFESDITISKKTDSTDNQILLGNPSGATNSTANADNYLIDHQYYVESYSRTRAAPNWVSWHIGAEDLGHTERLNNFRPDTGLPEGWYEVNQTGYKGSGFDKGHNCPSGDRTSSTAANSSTFLMNNIIPQAPNNNQHTWEHLESYCRTQVRKGNEVYVIMGSYGSGGIGKKGYFETIDDGRINVPSHIWKVVVVIPEGNNDLQRMNTSTRVIAIDTPNDNTIAPNWMKYLCTVRDIEKATGYDLLSALPKSLQDRIEIEKFKGGN